MGEKTGWRRSWKAIAGGFFALAGVSVVDYLTGPQLSMSAFYLIPICVVSWRAHWRWGVVMALLCASIWAEADILAGIDHSALVIGWNFVVRLATFLVIVSLLSHLRQRLEFEKQMARSDSLTGLSNRRHFYEVAELELARARRSFMPLSLAYIDVDHFKEVNDSLGHDGGDALLREIGEILRQKLRKTDLVARFGGDEFAILLPETSAEESLEVMQRLRSRLEAATKPQAPMVGYSMGLVTFARPPETVNALVKAADLLMYDVKKSGKGALRQAVLAGPQEVVAREAA